ncbi:hypothetical protein PCANB_002199 [Pneumocystis canis]|nr:hypothetical protein PCANB_002199 [Pneumocystis canis]
MINPLRLKSVSNTKYSNGPTGIVFLNMGGPSKLSEVKDFLFRIFTDKDLIPLGSTQNLLGSIIAKIRTPKVLNYYKKIGGGSPIYKWSDFQAQEVCKILDQISPNTAPHKPYVAFRYSAPLTESVLLEMLNNNITNAVAFTLYPQYSCSTTGSSLNELYHQIERLNIHNQIRWSVVDRWPTHSGLINAFKDNILETLKTYPENDRNNVIILFTAHSLPMSIVNRGDSYPLEVAATVYAVMEKLNFSNPYQLVWQSQVGPLRWLGPQTNHVINNFIKMGKQNIILVPISFVSDHIETLFDLQYIANARKSGFNGVKRVNSLNNNFTFIQGMADILKTHLNNGRKSTTQLELLCPSSHHGRSLKVHNVNISEKDLNSQSTTLSAKIIREDFEKSPLDELSYRLIELPNGIEVLLISDPTSNKAAASVDVKVGSMHDPNDYLGMAHFCEHLLFLGTKKYPQENYFEHTALKHGGNFNAYTSDEDTNFFFEVDSSSFHEILDIFSQFFIAPLFNEDSIHREVHAVDSEHKKNLRNDLWRLHELQKTTLNKTHPYSRFSTGNLETLIINPRIQNKNIIEEFHKFFKTHYYAEAMKVALYADVSLDTLQQWALEAFSQVPRKSDQETVIKGNPLDGKLGTYFIYKPLDDSISLHLEFPIPNQICLYKSHPIFYLMYLMTFEGPNSPIEYLRENDYASYISFDYHHINEEADILTIILGIYSDNADVIKALFQCLNFYRDASFQKEVFEELKQIQVMNFNYKGKPDIEDYVSSLSSAMQHSCLDRYYLLSSSVLKEFNPDDIKDLFNALRPDNFRVYLEYNSSSLNYNKSEPYYYSEYLEGALSEDFLEELKNITYPDTPLGFPKNTYIPENTNITMKKLDYSSVHPVLYRQSDISSLWYLYGSTHYIPRGTITIMLKNPLAFSSPLETLKLNFLAKYLSYSLVTDSYYSSMAGLNFDIKTVYQGFEIFIDGYSDQIIDLFNHIIMSIHDMSFSDPIFYGIRNYLASESISQTFLSPFSRVLYESELTLSPEMRESSELLYDLENLETADISVFFYNFFSNLYIDILVTGNIPPEDAMHIFYMTEAVYEVRPILHSELFQNRAIVLNNDSEDPNSAILYYCEVTETKNTRETLALVILSKILKEPIFTTLRTKLQLGYLVKSYLEQTASLIGYSIAIQSERQPHVLEARINTFFKDFMSYLEKLTDEDFSIYVNSIINSFKALYKNMIEEAKSIKSRIYLGTYTPRMVNNYIETYKSITKDEVIELYKNSFYRNATSPRKKFSQHLSSSLNSDIYNLFDISLKKLSEYFSTIGLSFSEEALRNISLISHNTTVFLSNISKHSSLTTNHKNNIGNFISGIYSFLKSEYMSEKEKLEHQSGSMVDNLSLFKAQSCLSRTRF